MSDRPDIDARFGALELEEGSTEAHADKYPPALPGCAVRYEAALLDEGNSWHYHITRTVYDPDEVHEPLCGDKGPLALVVLGGHTGQEVYLHCLRILLRGDFV